MSISPSLIIAFGAVVVFFYGLYRLINAVLWINGIVPINMKFNQTNLFEVYLSLGIVMIRCERRQLLDKRKHLQEYVAEHFPKSSVQFGKSYRVSYDMPSIKIRSACRWINKNIPDNGYKSQLLYFLAGVAFVDGRINHKEEVLLQKITLLLKLKKKHLDAVIEAHKEHFRRKFREEEHQKKKAKEARRKKSTDYKKRSMAKILEVDENASFDEIKKAYRHLVKLHHPDRFQNNGPEQIKLARERFIEIQHAYEFFENYMK